MADADIMGEILSQLEEKYDCAEQMLLGTKALERAVTSHNEDGIGTALEFRGQAIDRAQQLDQEISKKIESILSDSLKQRVTAILTPGTENVDMEEPLEYTIFDENRRIVILMRQIAQMDTSVRKKMEGRRY